MTKNFLQSLEVEKKHTSNQAPKLNFIFRGFFSISYIGVLFYSGKILNPLHWLNVSVPSNTRLSSPFR